MIYLIYSIYEYSTLIVFGHLLDITDIYIYIYIYIYLYVCVHVYANLCRYYLHPKYIFVPD